jgi:hypothetical protein
VGNSGTDLRLNLCQNVVQGTVVGKAGTATSPRVLHAVKKYLTAIPFALQLATVVASLGVAGQRGVFKAGSSFVSISSALFFHEYII